MNENRIPLGEMIQELREEIEAAQKQGKSSAFKFAFESLVLELSVVVSQTGTGKGGIKFWVVNAGVEYQKEKGN